MTEPHDEQKPAEQETSFLKEQAKYWKAFVHDLFIGTLKRMVVSPIVFGFTFLAIAYLIYRLSIKTQEVFIILKWIETMLLFLLYGIIGGFSGLLHGANSTLLKKAEELEQGVHLIVDPLMKTIITKIPGGQKGIEIDEFNTLLDTQISRYLSISRKQFRLLSLIGMFVRFFLRITLRILRYILLHDFLEGLREREETHITANAIEAFYREKLVSEVVGSVTGQLELVQHGIYGLLAFFLLIPIVLIIVL